MKQLYGRELKDSALRLKSFQLDESFLAPEDHDEAFVLHVDGVQYVMADTLPIDPDKLILVIGYLEAVKRPGKKIAGGKDKKRFSGCLASQYPLLREKPKGKRLMGYIKLDNTDYYIAVMLAKKKVPIVLSASIGSLLICGVLFTFFYNPITGRLPFNPDDFRPGAKGTGDIEDDEVLPPEVLYFNLSLNVTPLIKDGSMNIRIVNKEMLGTEKNTKSCVVEVSLIAHADKYGKELDALEEPIVIYESPLIYPGENIKDCRLDYADIEPGAYIGRAMYSVYDEDLYLIGKTAARLICRVE